MRENLEHLCEKFAVNREVLKKAFKLESDYILPVCALRLTGSGRDFSAEELKEMRQLVRGGTKMFSAYRNSLHLVCCTELMLTDDPSQRLKDTLAMQDVLKASFTRSSYSALLALQLSGMIHPKEAEEKVRRGKEIYRLMRQQHPFLTGSEDSVMAVLLAFSEKSDTELVEDMETVYQTLKEQISWSSGDALQTISHILALAGRPEAANRLVDLFRTLRDHGCAYGRDHELTTLALLAMTDRDVTSLAEDIMEVAEVLKEQKGYSALGMDGRMRRMHAAMLTEMDVNNGMRYGDARNAAIPASLVGGLSALAAQEAAMVAIMAATSASAAIASSSH